MYYNFRPPTLLKGEPGRRETQRVAGQSNKNVIPNVKKSEKGDINVFSKISYLNVNDNKLILILMNTMIQIGFSQCGTESSNILVYSVHPFSPYRNENINFHMNNDMFIMIWIVHILKIKPHVQVVSYL